MIEMPTFGRYTKGHYLEAHSDWNTYTDDEGQEWVRDFAFVYYLTDGWTAGDGGLLVDLGRSPTAPPTVPTFNRLITFGVPREHEVTRVVGDGERLTVYGWWALRKEDKEGKEDKEDKDD